MKKPKKLKRKNPAAGLDIIDALGLFSPIMPGMAMGVLMSGLNTNEQIQMVAAAHKKRQDILAARRRCPRCGPISVDLSEHTCPYGPQGNDCGTENAGENGARKPLKGDTRA